MKLRIAAKHAVRRLKQTAGLHGYHRIRGMKPWPDGKKWALYLSFDIDYKIDEDAVPLILETLRRHRVTASFACIGRMVEENPSLYRKISAEGHELVNHSLSHPFHKVIDKRHWSALPYSEVRSQIEGCHRILQELLDYTAVGFRTPHFDLGGEKKTLKALKELGYKYDSSGYDPACSPYGSYPYMNKGLLEIPCYRKLSSYYCMRYKNIGEAQWSSLLKDAMEKERGSGGVACFYFDPQDFAGRIEVLDGLCKQAKAANDLWVSDMKGIAERAGKR